MRKLFGSELNLNKKPIFIGAVCVLAVILIFGVLAVYTYAHKDIFPRVSAAGVSLGGLDRDEAISLLEGEAKSRYKDAAVEIKLENIAKRTVSAAELGVAFSASDIADAALKIGHEGGLFARLGAVISTLFAGAETEGAITVDEEALARVMAELSKNDIAAIDASYEVTESELVLHPGEDGKRLNTEELSKTVGIFRGA